MARITIAAPKTRKKKKADSPKRALDNRGAARFDQSAAFPGPNTGKRMRKPDEIYGDVSIPDSARKE